MPAVLRTGKRRPSGRLLWAVEASARKAFIDLTGFALGFFVILEKIGGMEDPSDFPAEIEYPEGDGETEAPETEDVTLSS